MRVTILNQFYTPDLAPTAHLSASLAERLAERGDEVRVVTSRGGYVAESSDTQAKKDDNPRIYRVWTPRLGKKNLLFRLTDYASFYVAAMLRMLLLPRQDVIVTLTTPPLIGLAALAHKCLHPGTQIVLWNMDCYPDIAETAGLIRRGGIISTIWQAVVRFQFRFLSHVVALDTAMKELLMERYTRNPDLPYTVIPNWEPIGLFSEPALEPKSATPEEPMMILYLGNAGFGHQFDTVIEAAGMLREEPIHFVFIGGGHRRKEIQEMAQERDLKNVELRGYVPKEETPAVMASAAAALITLSDDSKGIMSPSKLHSNLAMGLPIVYVGPLGSNVDEAIAEFDCGVSVRHGAAEEMAEYLRGLLNDQELQRSTRAAARRAFETRYCDRETLPQFETVLDAVATDD